MLLLEYGAMCCWKSLYAGPGFAAAFSATSDKFFARSVPIRHEGIFMGL